MICVLKTFYECRQTQRTLNCSRTTSQSQDIHQNRKSNKILGFLVVESTKKPEHFFFNNLISNIGSIATTSLLLKIVLVCYKVKSYLEKRFAILFNHYERSTRESVKWLVKVLENLQVAFSTNFGKVDLSFIC